MKHFVLLLVSLVLMATPVYAQTAASNDVVGTLTLYYAKTRINSNIEGLGGPFAAGTLILDSNDVFRTISSQNRSYYIIETDYDSGKILKSNITTKQYNMNRLAADAIGQEAVFVDKKGNKARIFRSSNNGHRFKLLSTKFQQLKREFPDMYNDMEMPADKPIPIEGCYVLSVEYPNYTNRKELFEEPLTVTNGFLDLYTNSLEGLGNSFSKIVGVLEDAWGNPESWPEGKSAYDAQGRLLTDQEQNWPEPYYNSCSIAYIAAEDALYFNGTLYYRQK